MTTAAPQIVFCPDSFKGTATAAQAARWLADGWHDVRVGDDLVLLGQADGGEGTAEAIAAAEPDGTWYEVAATGPDGRPVTGRWYRQNATATCDLAQVSGLPLMAAPGPLTATTRGVGEVIAAAVAAGCTRIQIGLGGSASTDGGAGALAALGWSLLDHRGRSVPEGGAGLAQIAEVVAPDWPADLEVTLVTDVTAPLLGPRGAAAVFGPQKGASAEEVALLESALTHWSGVLGGDPHSPGAGAAGGIGYGLATALGAQIVPGASWVAERSGLSTLLPTADLVVTGEGRFDATSMTGKVVGSILASLDDPRRLAVVAGQVDPAVQADEVRTVSLTELAGSPESALSDPRQWLTRAGQVLAQGFTPGSTLGA